MPSTTDKHGRFGALERDPMATGTPPEDFDKLFLRCTILTGTQIQRRDRCPDQCAGQLNENCTHHDDLDEQHHVPAPAKVSAPTEAAPVPTPSGGSIHTDEAPVEQADAETSVEVTSALVAPQAAAEAMGDADTTPTSVEAADEHLGHQEPADVANGTTLETDAVEVKADAVEVEVEVEVVGAPPEVDEGATPEVEDADALEANVVAMPTVEDEEVISPEQDVEATVPDQGDLILPGEKAAYLKVPLDLDQALAAVDGADINPAEVTDERLANWHVELQNHACRGVAHAVVIGRALAARKSKLPHGKYSPWVVSLGISTRTASDYMKLSAAYYQNGSALPISPGASIRKALSQIKADKNTSAEQGGEGGVGDVPAKATDASSNPSTKTKKTYSDAEKLTLHLEGVAVLVTPLDLEERERWLAWVHDYLLPEKAGRLVPTWCEAEVAKEDIDADAF